MDKKWILVWDLDQTLVHEVDEGVTSRKILNLNAVKFLDKAIELRDDNKSVAYIFLLTNNSNTRYIADSMSMISQNILRYPPGVTYEMQEYYDMKPYAKIFDAIKYTKRNNLKSYTEIFDIPASDKRDGDPDNPTKSLKDIADLIQLAGSEANVLDYKIMFFDDRADHLLREELKGSNIYKVIAPMEDNSRFSDQSFQRELDLLEGRAGEGGGAGGGAAGGGERKQVGAARKRITKRKRKNKKPTKKLTKKPRSATSPTNNASKYASSQA